MNMLAEAVQNLCIAATASESGTTVKKLVSIVSYAPSICVGQVLGVLLVIATLQKSLVNYLGSCPKSQKGLKIPGKIVEGNSKVLAI